MKVEILRSDDARELQRWINSFCERHKVIDIKFAETYHQYKSLLGYDATIFSTALLMYED